MKLGISRTSAICAAAAGTMIASGLGLYVWKHEQRPALLEILVFALSHGHAAFIITPSDERILIGGGSNGEVVRRISKHLPFYSRRIDKIIATDTEGKNVSGLIDVVNRYSVGRAYIPAHTLESVGISSSTDPAFKELLVALKRQDVPIERIEAGTEIVAGADLVMRGLFPVSPAEFGYSRASSPEVLLSVSHGGNSIFFMGKASRKIQTFAASSTDADMYNSHILITFNNGSAGQLSAELIGALKPNYFVYSRAVSYSAPRSDTRVPEQVFDVGERINVREHAYVKITSDGTSLIVTRVPR